MSTVPITLLHVDLLDQHPTQNLFHPTPTLRMEAEWTAETSLLLFTSVRYKDPLHNNTNTLKSVIIRKEIQGTPFTKDYTGLKTKIIEYVTIKHVMYTFK